MDNEVTVKSGKDLSTADINQINQAFARVFPENEPLKFGDPNLAGDTFFFVYSPNGEIVATGRLRPVELEFRGEKHEIQGIADIISNQPGHGFGKKIMGAIKQWLTEKDEVGIGFCENTSEFYRKSGFKIYPGLTSRFYYPNKWTGKLESYNSDVLYWANNDFLIETILKTEDEKVLIPYPW
jgi:hypothetical protein